MGRTREWKKRYWTMVALLVVIIAAYFLLYFMFFFFIYELRIGVISAMAIFLTGAAFLGAAALWIGGAVVNMEHGSPMTAKEALRQKEVASRSQPRKRP